jgi:hypothetical protein
VKRELFIGGELNIQELLYTGWVSDFAALKDGYTEVVEV